jgi:prefoldin subunit 5
MREQLEQRLSGLRAEQQKGQQMLAGLEAKQAELHQTLLRISGAIQVLEELLAGAAQQDGLVPAAASPPTTGS